MKNTFLVVVTGKSGSGKSAFSKLLAQDLDADIIDFDKISHKSLENEKIKSKLISIFGENILTNNHINRKLLGEIVFNDKEKLKILNNICQIFIENTVDELIKTSNKQFIILEYALLTKMKYFFNSNFKILIKAPSKIRISRISQRDNLPLEYIEKRESCSLKYLQKKFDEIVYNNSNSYKKLQIYANNIAKKIQTSINIL